MKQHETKQSSTQVHTVDQDDERYVGTTCPGVGVGVIIRNGEQVLLLRRINAHGSGTWSPPGGHLEFGETLEQCAVREVKEETGLEVADPAFFAVTNDLFAADGKHYITLWMEAAYRSGQPIVNAPDESDRIGWYAWDALPEPLFVPLHNLLCGESYPPQNKFRR